LSSLPRNAGTPRQFRKQPPRQRGGDSSFSSQDAPPCCKSRSSCRCTFKRSVSVPNRPCWPHEETGCALLPAALSRILEIPSNRA
jgi:hypothetical protein